MEGNSTTPTSTTPTTSKWNLAGFKQAVAHATTPTLGFGDAHSPAPDHEVSPQQYLSYSHKESAVVVMPCVVLEPRHVDLWEKPQKHHRLRLVWSAARGNRCDREIQQICVQSSLF